MSYYFPFGQELHPLVQEDKSPKKVFVLGVYASAVHAKWIREGQVICRALAVASEPRIFWDGDVKEAEKIISEVKIPEEMGKLVLPDSQFNGPSAKVLENDILAPLGFTRQDAWLCDCLPETRLNPGQVKALQARYVPMMEKYGLNEVTVPHKQSIYCDDKRAAEITEELKQSGADLLILLGDVPIRQYLKRAANVPYASLQEYTDLYGYGNITEAEIAGKTINVLPFAHPRQIGALGTHSEKWHRMHAEWLRRNEPDNSDVLGPQPEKPAAEYDMVEKTGAAFSAALHGAISTLEQNIAVSLDQKDYDEVLRLGELCKKFHSMNESLTDWLQSLNIHTDTKQKPVYTEPVYEAAAESEATEISEPSETVVMDVEPEKQPGDDCRALRQDNLAKLISGGGLEPFVDLVRNHPELEMCFRGNSDPEMVVIYMNNHQVIKLKLSGTVTISFDHARYSENWEEYLSVLKKYGFSVRDNVLRDGGKSSVGEISRSSNNRRLSSQEVDALYTGTIRPMFDCYFAAAGRKGITDFFKKAVGIGKYVVTPHSLTEKVAQHRLFSIFKFKRSGYFFYDLEFSQRHENKRAQDLDENRNEPDMQAIKFDDHGKPESIVFVEVKCTKAAWNGSSGLADHIRKMREYEKDEVNMAARRKEAYLLLKQYAALGLRGLSTEDVFDYEDFKDLPLEILIILTDEAKGLWEKDNSAAMTSIKNHAAVYMCPECSDALIFRIQGNDMRMI